MDFNELRKKLPKRSDGTMDLERLLCSDPISVLTRKYCEMCARNEDLASAMRRALKHLDAMPSGEYFAEVEKDDDAHPWVRALHAMHDELRNALQEIGQDYHGSYAEYDANMREVPPSQ